MTPSPPAQAEASETVERVRFSALLDTVHSALRGIDAADQTAIIPAKQLDAVSGAVMVVEAFARLQGINLSEFAGTQPQDFRRCTGGGVHADGSCIVCAADQGQGCRQRRRSITKSDSQT